MPIRRARSRDGTIGPIRSSMSQDNNNNSDSTTTAAGARMTMMQQEPLLKMESGELPLPQMMASTTTCPRNRHSPSSLHHHNSTIYNSTASVGGNVDSIALPNLSMTTPLLSTSSSATFTTTSFSGVVQRVLASARHNPEAVSIGVALAAWYFVGVLAICTTKLLLSTSIQEGGVPSPLVLTFQQMLLGSNLLRLFLVARNNVQPWPKEDINNGSNNIQTKNRWASYVAALDFLLLAGLFNGLDFLASNTSFSHSSATFVETIKASEPITTTCLAIWWGIDRLGKWETLSLTILITGVLMSTYANAMAKSVDAGTTIITEEGPPLAESIKTCLTVMTANLCFAFRAMSQKLLRSSQSGSAQNLDDFNLLFRMQQTGAASLLGPVLLFQNYTVLQVLFGRPSWHIFGYYVGLSLVNAWAFATYSLASCYILSRISVVQHSGLGCLRRMFAIVATSIAFGVPISWLGALGILMCVVGFSGFTHFRFQRQGQSKKSSKNEENDNTVTGISIAGNIKHGNGFNSTTNISRSTSSSGVETAPLSSGSSSSEDVAKHSEP